MADTALNIVINAKDNASKQVENVAKTFRTSFRSIALTTFGVGSIGYAIRSLADGITAASQAAKNGESAFVAFGHSLPLIGTLAKSISTAMLELSGTLDEIKKAEEQSASVDAVNKRRASIKDLLEISKAQTEGEKERIKLRLKYEAIEKEIIAESEKSGLSPTSLIKQLKILYNSELKVIWDKEKKEGQKPLDSFVNKTKQIQESLDKLNMNELQKATYDLDKEFNAMLESYRSLPAVQKGLIESDINAAIAAYREARENLPFIYAEKKESRRQFMELGVSPLEARFLQRGPGVGIESLKPPIEKTANNTTKSNQILEQINAGIKGLPDKLKTGTSYPETNFN